MTTQVRVLSYNIHSQRDDATALRDVVRTTAPDVVIVQEAPRRFRWRAKCAALARSFGMVVAAGGLPSMGNLVLTSLRVRVRGTRCVRFPLTPGRHLRGAVLADCVIAENQFTVVGSHLSTDPVERPVQAALLKAELSPSMSPASAGSSTPAPVILGADLNEDPTGSAWRTLVEGLVDVAVVADRADQATYSCANPRQRLDVLLVDPRITVRRYEVLDTARTRQASDHFPILAELSLPS